MSVCVCVCWGSGEVGLVCMSISVCVSVCASTECSGV